MEQIACLLAEREGIDNIIFSGGFIRDNAYVWSKISFGLDFWSNRYCGAAYAHVCSRMLTYAHVCRRMLTKLLAGTEKLRMLTYADVC